MLVFISFSISALCSSRRSYLFLGGTLSSLVSVLFMASLVNLFLGSASLFSIELYLGLLIFCGYLMYDTQLIVERAEMGSSDTVGHAAMLFSDFVAVFIRLLIILTRRRDSERKRE